MISSEYAKVKHVYYIDEKNIDYTTRCSARQAFADAKKAYAEQLEITKVVFNKPATIVLWSDGSKTVVKVQKGDKFDKEKGLAMAIAKRMLGNKGSYNNEFKKWIK